MLITEEFDERKFCKYYLRGYQKLKELDRQKFKGVKYSKAFSDFTCLLYANIGELTGGNDSFTNSENTNAKVRLEFVSFEIYRQCNLHQ